MKITLIVVNLAGLVLAVLGLLKGVTCLINDSDQRQPFDNSDATHICIVSSLLLCLALIAIYSTYFENGYLLLAYGLCLLLSLFLTPLFWSATFLQLSFSSNSSSSLPSSSSTVPIAPIAIVATILLLMSFSISLSLKIRNARAQYQSKLDNWIKRTLDFNLLLLMLSFCFLLLIYVDLSSEHTSSPRFVKGRNYLF